MAGAHNENDHHIRGNRIGRRDGCKRRGYAFEGRQSEAHAFVVGYSDDNGPRGSGCFGQPE
jgi:hypothetical protein